MNSLQSRMELLVATFATMFPQRVANRSYADIYSLKKTESAKGVFSFVFQNESDYDNTLTQKAVNGTQKVVLIARRYLTDTVDGEAIENEELTMLDEIKQLVNAANLPAEIQNISLKNARSSAQQENPLAWVIADLEITD